MGRVFFLELKMGNAEQAKKVLPLIQSEIMGYSVKSDGTLLPDAVEDIKETLSIKSDSFDAYSITIRNLKIEENIISMFCTPEPEDCEGGIGCDFTQDIAKIFPEFSFTYSSEFEDSVSDISYHEQASLTGCKTFNYSYTESTPWSNNSKNVEGQYEINGWEMTEENTENEEVLFELECEDCGESIEVTESMLEEGEIVCPQCGVSIEIDPEFLLD